VVKSLRELQQSGNTPLIGEPTEQKDRLRARLQLLLAGRRLIPSSLFPLPMLQRPSSSSSSAPAMRLSGRAVEWIRYQPCWSLGRRS
jgi:hypothetical protein